MCKKVSLQCYVIGFTIFHLAETAAGGVLLEKLSLKISKNSQKNTCGIVSFSVVARCTLRRLLLIFHLSCLEDFLIILFQQKNEMKKGKYPDGVQICTFFARVLICWINQRFQRKFDRNLIKKCV